MVLVLVLGFVMLVVFPIIVTVLEVGRRGYGPTRREIVVGAVMGLASAGVIIALDKGGHRMPNSVEFNLIFFGVGIPAALFIRWRWGDAINRWFRG